MLHSEDFLNASSGENCSEMHLFVHFKTCLSMTRVYACKIVITNRLFAHTKFSPGLKLSQTIFGLVHTIASQD